LNYGNLERVLTRNMKEIISNERKEVHLAEEIPMKIRMEVEF
jgi:hypothetical protein